MSLTDLSFTAPIRLRTHGEKPGSRHFVSLPKETANQIKELTKNKPRKGWGSVKVKVRIGFVTRETSIFPDKKSNSYLLPLKADVRKQLHIGEGDEVLVHLDILQ